VISNIYPYKINALNFKAKKINITTIPDDIDFQNVHKKNLSYKSALKSAEVFNFEEAMEVAKKRSGNIDFRLKCMEKKNMLTQYLDDEVKTALLNLKEETISALSDKQIESFITMIDTKTCIEKINSLETTFSNEQLRRISVGDYKNYFSKWLFDSEKSKEEKDLIIEKLSKI